MLQPSGSFLEDFAEARTISSQVTSGRKETDRRRGLPRVWRPASRARADGILEKGYRVVSSPSVCLSVCLSFLELREERAPPVGAVVSRRLCDGKAQFVAREPRGAHGDLARARLVGEKKCPVCHFFKTCDFELSFGNIYILYIYMYTYSRVSSLEPLAAGARAR